MNRAESIKRTLLSKLQKYSRERKYSYFQFPISVPEKQEVDISRLQLEVILQLIPDKIKAKNLVSFNLDELKKTECSQININQKMFAITLEYATYPSQITQESKLVEMLKCDWTSPTKEFAPKHANLLFSKNSKEKPSNKATENKLPDFDLTKMKRGKLNI